MSKYSLFLITLLTFFAVACEESAADIALATPGQSSSTGTGGSLARFTIKGDFLYTVDAQNLNVFNISSPDETIPVATVQAGFGVETIYPLENFLYLGTQNGMLIFQVGADGIPALIGNYNHITSCDPVVSDGHFAYVTLRVSECQEAAFGAANTLDVLDVSDPTQPNLLSSYPMDSPYGLGLDENILFVCEGERGFKVMEVSDPQNIVLLQQITSVNAIDVITLDGLLLVIGPDAVVEYDYSDIHNIQKLSEIAIGE
ncbi:MAG TPA: hypothetical protein PKA00_03475 [Saprospiraceae bacterium]|nr:hypothetical protein [Saprospiraceae bacterium]HMQ81937.1 hypothetical protein [Saprospiraceae bacterium]